MVRNVNSILIAILLQLSLRTTVYRQHFAPLTLHLERTVTFCLLPPSPIKICCTIAVFLFDRPAKHLPSSVQMSTSQQYKIANKKKYSVLTTVMFACLRWTEPYWANICPRCTSRGSLCCFLLNLRSGADMWSARTRVLGPPGSTSASQKSTSNVCVCVRSFAASPQCGSSSFGKVSCPGRRQPYRLDELQG